MTNLNPAQKAAQDEARDKGRFGEQTHTHPGQDIIGAGRVPELDAAASAADALSGPWRSRSFAARQLADEAMDQAQTQNVAAQCLRAFSRFPEACWLETTARYGDSSIEIGRPIGSDGFPMGPRVDNPYVVDLHEGTGSAPWMDAYDSLTRRIDLQRAIRIAQVQPKPRPLRPSLTEIQSQVSVLEATRQEKKVRWCREGSDDISEGTVRGGVWTAAGQIASHKVDARDAHVRITTRMGMDMWVPFNEMVDAHMDNRLAWEN